MFCLSMFSHGPLIIICLFINNFENHDVLIAPYNYIVEDDVKVGAKYIVSRLCNLETVPSYCENNSARQQMRWVFLDY